MVWRKKTALWDTTDSPFFVPTLRVKALISGADIDI